MRQDAEVWAKSGSRAELAFDDGSVMRLGGGAAATLQTMYSDDQGEFTEIKLNNGLSTFHLRNAHSEYQIDTPLSSIRAYGPCEVRVGVDGNSVEVACLEGQARLEGLQGQAVLHKGQLCDIADTTSPYVVTEEPGPDSWDVFNSSRDVVYEHHDEHVPHNIDLVAGDLDQYGSWHDDPDYGYVWAPRVHEADWRPYHDGHWTWVSPWGWTWVGDEPWGYAPYHYGSWVDRSYGWAWAPGPSVQYWSPAVVDFVENDDDVCWTPLAPAEVSYPPAIDIGFRSGDWWLNFSIGGTAMYYPESSDRCAPRPWENRYVNREVNVYNVTNINNYYADYAREADPYFVRGGRFRPRNAIRYPGMTLATHQAFLHGGRFGFVSGDPAARIYEHGRSFARAPRHGHPISGVFAGRPIEASFTPTRKFEHNAKVPSSAFGRTDFRTALPHAIAMRSGSFGDFRRPSRRSAPISHEPASGLSRIRSTNALHRGSQPIHRGPVGGHPSMPTQHGRGGPVHHLTPPIQRGGGHPSMPTQHGRGGPVHHSTPPVHRGSGHPSMPTQHGRGGPIHHSTPPIHRGGGHPSMPTQHGRGGPVHHSMPPIHRGGGHPSMPTQHGRGGPVHHSTPPIHRGGGHTSMSQVHRAVRRNSVGQPHSVRNAQPSRSGPVRQSGPSRGGTRGGTTRQRGPVNRGHGRGR